jgi:type IV conjugative transfer system protein TraE
MRLKIASNSVERIAGQRNLFLALTVLLGTTACALSIKMVALEERIVMVPPLTSDVMISNRRVSSSYLEQMTMIFLNCLLDLSAADVMHKRDLILKYTSNSNENFPKNINEYFAKAAEEYKQFDLVTYFTPKNMEIFEKENVVIAHGILTSRYGKHGFENNPCSYRLSYEFSGGFLRLKEFSKVIDEQEKKAKESEGKTAINRQEK